MKYRGAPLVQQSQRLVKFKKITTEKKAKEKKGDPDEYLFEVLEFLVTPLRFGFEEWVADHGIIAPVPPKKAVEVNGKHVRGITNAVEMEIDPDDPEYLKQERIYGRRMVALKLAEVLRSDKNIEFETSEPELNEEDHLAHKKWCKYADTLAGELEQTTLTFFEVQHLFSTADEISMDYDIEEATKSFLPEQESDQKENEAS